MTFRRTRCPHCRAKLEAGQRIHAECIEPYAEAQEAKAKRTAEKQQLMAAKVERAETRRRKETVKTNGQRKAEAQAAVNEYVRLRDADLPCISCGRKHDGAWHAGHYRSRGSAPHLALDPRNLRRQCAPCNLYLHGNLIGYRAGLIEREGLAFVEALESDQEPRHYSGDDYDRIKAEHRALTKQLKKERA